MTLFLTIIVLLSGLFALHLVCWRVALPRRQRAVLLLLFLGGGFVFAPLVAWLVDILGFAPLSWVEWLNVALAVLALSMALIHI